MLRSAALFAVIMLAVPACAQQTSHPPVIWQLETQGRLSHQPAVAEGAIFLGSCSGTFYAVDANAGGVRWSYDAKQDRNQSSFHGNPVLTADLVVIGVDHGTDPQGQGHVYAFERATGKVRWKQLAAPGVSSDVLTDESLVIALVQTGELIGFDIHSGQSIWKKQVTESGRDRYLPSPVLRNHVVYAGGYSGNLTAVNAQTGDRVWQQNLEPGTHVQPVAVGDGVYAVTDSSIYKVDLSTGRGIRSLRFDATPSFQPVPRYDRASISGPYCPLFQRARTNENALVSKGKC